MASGTSLTNGGDQSRRRALDFYPTPPAATHALMVFLKRIDAMPARVWECACGEYAMSNVISAYTDCVATDVIYDQNYLLENKPEQVDAIITNPPFSLAEQFILKAVSEVPLTAFLLKSQYWHSAKRAALFFNHRPAYVLPLLWRPDFMNGERGGSPTMDVLWTVWRGISTTTQFEPLYRPVV